MTYTDLRFGSLHKIGNSTKFGASTMEANLAWGIEVDWDGDGIFSGASEHLYACGLRISRGRTAMLRSTGGGFETIRTGNAVLTLWNDDGRYNGWNTSSPLYPNVSPGKEVKIRVRNLQAASLTINDVFYGVISDIVPIDYGERPRVAVHIDDCWNFLRNYSARVAFQNNISVDSAIGLVLDAVGWSPRWGRNLESSVDTISYWWGSGDKTAAVECEDLANSVFGNFFIAADGSARFITRTSIGASVADFDQSELYKDIQNPQPWVFHRNVTELRVHVRDATSTALLYEQFGDAVQILNGEEYIDFVSLTFNGVSVPALSLIDPVINVDYGVYSAASGGSNVSASCAVTVTALGDRAKRSIRNNSGATAYVQFFKIRGTAVYERNVADISYPKDTSSVVNPRKFFIDLLWQQNANTATDFANLFGPFLDSYHPFPIITLESNYAKQFGIELFDATTLTSSKLGIGGVSFRVGGIEHETLDENMQRVKTTFYLEPYVAGGDYGTFPLTWGSSTFGW